MACALGFGLWTGLAGCTGTVGQPASIGGSGERPDAGPSVGQDASSRSDGGLVSEPEPLAAHRSQARRLSRNELDRVVDGLLFGTEVRASNYLNEDEYTPFDNDVTRQTVSSALVTSLELMAHEVARGLTSDPERYERLLPCQPSGPSDTPCLRRFVESFGKRAFRRPLTPEEVELYLGLQTFATRSEPFVDNGFDTAVELIIAAILQDPEFLYRIEIGTPTEAPGVRALDDWEIATRLSFLIWGEAPDDALLADAEAGRLTGPERRSVAERMLDDPRARAQVQRLHRMWLGFRALPVEPELAARFDRETSALIDRVVFGDRPYRELFTSPQTYVDGELADHYGLPRPEGSEGWVDYGDSGRMGILSHGSVLAAFSKFTDTSPTQRGILVRSRLLCLPVLSPPPSVDVDQPPAGEAACKVDRYKAHMGQSGCKGCHEGMDPIGFGLENYDMTGRYREADDGDPSCLIDGQGELPAGLGAFSGPRELSERLLASGRLNACAAEHFLRYALGRPLVDGEGRRAEALAEALDRGFKDLLLEFVSDPTFGRVAWEEE